MLRVRGFAESDAGVGDRPTARYTVASYVSTGTEANINQMIAVRKDAISQIYFHIEFKIFIFTVKNC